jgi:peptidyl-prolyl cis-trans isomerase D
MMKFLRSQSQTVLIVVLAVIGFGFLFYGNAGNLLTNQAGHVHTDFGRIDGEDLSAAQLIEAVRNARDLLMIQGHARELNQPGARAQLAQEAWRELLLLHEADRLHIQVSDQQLVAFIQNMPVFQKNGIYSPEVFQSQMTNLQNNFHLNPDTFENLLRSSLRLEAMRNALLSNVRASAQNVSDQYEKYHAPTQVSLVSFDSKSFINSVQVTPEEIAAEYKSHPENPVYRTPEKRKVDYVLFSLTPEQTKLPPKEKQTALEALGEKALDFVLGLQSDPTATGNNAPPSDFVEGAKKIGLTPVATNFFTADTPPAGVPPSPSFNSAAFSLTKENPISKVVELENGVAVLHLAEIQPSDLRPIEEVKPEIVKALQQEKGNQALQAAAQNAAQALKAAVANGTDFKAAAAALNLKVETPPAFIPMQTSEKDLNLRAIAYTVTSLPVGAVSDPIPMQSNKSFFIVHLDGRAKADPVGLAQFETQYRQQQEQMLGSDVYNDWAEWRSKRPGTHKPPELDQYGSIE